MKKNLKCLIAVGILAWVPMTEAQLGARPGGPGPETRPMLPPEVEMPDEIKAIRDEVVALRNELATSRQAVLDALGDDATREERLAALQAWRESDAVIADVQAVRDLNLEMREALKELGISAGREPIELPEEIAAAREELAVLTKELADSRRALVSGLPEDATLVDRRAALEAWRTANAEAIAELESLRAEVGDWIRDNRPDRGPRPGVNAHLRDRVQEFRRDAEIMKQARLRLRERLANAETEEQRREILRQFRERYRNLMEERKELKRLERLAGNGVGGDRRPGG
jgi:DNA repair exonuclease SbcCD ATPase subunit